MSPEHTQAVLDVLTKASARLEFRSNPHGGELAEQIAETKRDIDRAAKMLRLVNPAVNIKPL